MENLVVSVTVATLYLPLWKCFVKVTKTATTESRRSMCSPILILEILNSSQEMNVAW